MATPEEGQQAIDDLIAKQGIADSVTPANLGQDQLQAIFNAGAKFDPNYTPGKAVKTGVMVVDDGALCVSLADTSEPAAPIRTSIAGYSQPDDRNGYNTQQDNSVVASITDMEFTEDCSISSVRVGVPAISSTIEYFLSIFDTTSGSKLLAYYPLNTLSLSQNGWNSVVSGASFIKSGNSLRFQIESINKSSSNQITGSWTYEGTGSGAPATSSINLDLTAGLLRVDKSDLAPNDRSAELLSVLSTSLQKIEQQSNPDKFFTFRTVGYPVDQGSYVEYVIAVVSTGLSGPDDAEATTLEIDVPIPQSTQYLERISYWPTAQPGYATVTGALEFNGVDQAAKVDNAFTVDVEVSTVSVSDDWAVLAFTNTIFGISSGSSNSAVIAGDSEVVEGQKFAFLYSVVDQVPLVDNVAETVLFEINATPDSEEDLTIDPLTGLISFNFSGWLSSSISFNVGRTGAGASERFWVGAERSKVGVVNPDPNDPNDWEPYGLMRDVGDIRISTERTYETQFNIPFVSPDRIYRIRMASQDASEGLGLYNEFSPAFANPSGSCNFNAWYKKNS